jgi:MFS family permease
MFNQYLSTIRQFNRNVYLFLITLGLAVLILDGVYAVVFNLYLLRLGYDPTFVGKINSIGLLTFALASMPAGSLGSRWGSRRAMIVGLYIVFVGGLLLPFAGMIVPDLQEVWLFVTYPVMFFGYALFFVNGVTFLMAATKPDQRNLAFSAQTAIFSLAGFVGGLLGGLLPGLFAMAFALPENAPAAYRFPLWVGALLLIPGIWAASSTTQEPPKPRIRQSGGLSLASLRSIDHSYLWLLVAVSVVRVLTVSGMAVTNTFFNVYMDQSLHVTTAQIGMITATARLISIPIALSMAALAAKWGSYRLVIYACLGTAIALLPLALVPLVGAAAIGFIGVGAASVIRYPAFLVYSMELVREDQRQTMSGLSEMTAGVSFSLMALLGGYIITSSGYTSLFLTGAIFVFAGAAFFAAYFRRSRSVIAPLAAPTGGTD